MKTVPLWRNPGYLVAVSVLCASALGLFFAIEAAHVYLTKMPIEARSGLVLAALPADTTNWIRVGTDHVESAEIIDELGTDNYLTRTYQEKEGRDGHRPRTVQLHVAYYTGMIDTVPHVPDRCFVGGGLREGPDDDTIEIHLDRSTWLEVDVEREDWKGRVYSMKAPNEYGNTGGDRVTLPRDPDRIKMRAMNFIDDRLNSTLYAGYFFIANGGTVARAEGVRMLAFDLSDDYAYYTKVQITSPDVNSLDELGEVTADLLNDLIGDIMYCLPDWVEVDQGEWPEQRAVAGSDSSGTDPARNQ